MQLIQLYTTVVLTRPSISTVSQNELLYFHVFVYPVNGASLSSDVQYLPHNPFISSLNFVLEHRDMRRKFYTMPESIYFISILTKL
jgi:hypothetical protein